MARGNWRSVAEDIAQALHDMVGDRSRTHTLDELLAQSGAGAEPGDYRTRSYWAAEQRGEQHARAFRNAGLVLSFFPDERGVQVESVTFRLDHFAENPS